jgi:activator of HSP90 ATPase
VKTIRQSVTFKATPRQVYEALMNSRKHSKFTGARAIISRRIGGTFKAYGKYISGTNIDLIPDKKIVQSWRANEKGWPKSHYSRVTFSLRRVKGGTRLVFTQSGVPDRFYRSMKQGWHDAYWTPMKKMFEKPKAR